MHTLYEGINRTSILNALSCSADSEEEMGSNDDEIEHEDVCSRCRHGGELICCDTCPKAFHMECCKPVLRRVPKGHWECENCKKGTKSAAIRVPTGNKGALFHYVSTSFRLFYFDWRMLTILDTIYVCMNTKRLNEKSLVL